MRIWTKWINLNVCSQKLSIINRRILESNNNLGHPVYKIFIEKKAQINILIDVSEDFNMN